LCSNKNHFSLIKKGANRAEKKKKMVSEKYLAQNLYTIYGKNV